LEADQSREEIDLIIKKPAGYWMGEQSSALSVAVFASRNR